MAFSYLLLHVEADECTAVMKGTAVAAIAKLAVEFDGLVSAFNDNCLKSQLLYPFLGTFDDQPAQPFAAIVLKDHDAVKVKSIYSHLAAAEDPAEDAYTMGQIEMFRTNAGTISDAIGYRPMYHILNSAGIERFTQYQFDMVRLGIGIYGISSVPGIRLAPVASLKCKILQIKHLKPGDGNIGYGRWGKIAPEGTTIATIPCGYADGIDRHLGRGRCSFMLNGKRVPTIGNICMDMCMLDITGVDAKVGDVVTIFGEDPSVDELAEILDTIPYEILTSIPRRIERVVTI